MAPSLFVQQVDAQRRFERSWAEIQGYLLSVLDAAGVDPITAEELTVIPGAEEVLALLELRTQVLSGEWDVVVVDCAPTAETLRLLALPEALGLVHGPGLPGRAPHREGAAAGAGPGGRRADAARRGVRRGRAAAPRPRGGARAAHRDGRQRAAGAHPRDRRGGRGPPLADHAVAVRLPGRRRRRQPGVPRATGADAWRAAGSRRRPAVLAEVRAVVHRPAGLAVGYQPAEPVGVDALARLRRGGVRRRRPARAADGESRR